MQCYLAGEITQVKEPIPWVRCASGNVLDAIIFGTDFETFWNHICSRPNPGHIRSRTLPVTCNISDWQSTYSFNIAKIQGPRFVLSSMEGSSIIINQHQFIHTHTYVQRLQKVVANCCRCRKIGLWCRGLCENASPVIFHMPTGHPSTNFSKTDILTISKHLWVNCGIPLFESIHKKQKST